MNAPIIVTGPDRSGTTLMFALLASHPRISMSRRTNMWRWFYGRFGDLGEQQNLEACLDVMFRYHRLAQLEPDRARIEEEFLDGPPTYGRLFGLFHEHHAQRLGRQRWGDKSLHTEHFADAILEDFPEARIIHMMRDPRDRYASVSRRYPQRSKGIASIAGRWIVSTRRGHRNREAHSDRYLIVRYEDLARAPEATLRQVCSFIDEEYDPVMLGMRGAPRHGDEGNSSFERIEPGVISTKSIGRWRDILSPEEAASIQVLTGTLMRSHGYQTQSIPMRSKERLRFLSTRLPVDAARMAGWLLTSGRRERAGREIPSERLLDVPLDRDAEGLRSQAHQGDG